MTSPRPSVIIVEDEGRVRSLLEAYLTEHGFPVFVTKTALEATLAVDDAGLPAVMLIDAVLPDGSGLDLVRRVRLAHPDIGLILVNGRADPVDHVLGLELGADDYIARPLHMREVLARVASLLRRIERSHPVADTQTNVFAFDGWQIDIDRRSLSRDGDAPQPLTTAEFELLKVLVLHAGRVMDRQRLLDLTRGRHWHACDRSIDAQISRLRKRIEDNPRQPQIIKSVRAVGYVMAAPVTRVRSGR